MEEQKKSRGRRARRTSDPRNPKGRPKRQSDYRMRCVLLENIPLITKSQFKAQCVRQKVPMTDAIICMMEQCLFEKKSFGRVRVERGRSKANSRNIRIPAVKVRLWDGFKAYCYERDVTAIAALITMMDEVIKGKRKLRRTASLQKRFDDAQIRRDWIKAQRKEKKRLAKLEEKQK